MEELEKIQELEEKYNVNILMRDEFDEELSGWVEDSVRDIGFRRTIDEIKDEEYMEEDYQYYVVRLLSFPHAEYCCQYIEELEEYLENK